MLLALAGLQACGGREAPPLAADPAAAAGQPAAGVSAGQMSPDTVVARYGHDAITVGDLDAEIGAMRGAERLEFTGTEPLRDLVEALIDRRLMAAAAVSLGLDRDDALMGRLAGAGQGSASPREVMLAEAYLERRFGDLPAPTPAEIETHYRANAEQFTIPARARVTRVVAATAEGAERLRAMLGVGATLADLRANDAAGVVRAEEIWLHDGLRKSEMEALALALRPGETSAVLTTAAGYGALRVEEQQPARLRPLAEIEPAIVASLAVARRRAAAAQLRENLRSAVQVSVDESLLSSYQAPPGGPAGGDARPDITTGK